MRDAVKLDQSAQETSPLTAYVNKYDMDAIHVSFCEAYRVNPIFGLGKLMAQPG